MRKSGRLRVLRDVASNNLKNKRILLRVDFNVSLNSKNEIDDKEDWRIKAALPTIKYLLEQRAKIILLAHLGRPKGKAVENLRLGSVQDKLSELLSLSVKRMPNCVGKNVEKAVREMETSEILMLENLRFYGEEEENNENFSKNLAKLGDFYVNDAFSDCHRAHASIVGITKFLPSYAGFLLEKEVKMMKNAKNPSHPAIAIIGGAKIETKLPAVNALAKIYDHVLVGGMIANEIIKAPYGDALSPNVILPVWDGIAGDKRYDISLNSIKIFSKFVQKAKTIIWNGPIGKFEEAGYEAGTKKMIKLIKAAQKNGAKILIGGGETIYAVQRFAPELMEKKLKNLNISTGGGAMLEFLSGKQLPGIEVLLK